MLSSAAGSSHLDTGGMQGAAYSNMLLRDGVVPGSVNNARLAVVWVEEGWVGLSYVGEDCL